MADQNQSGQNVGYKPGTKIGKYEIRERLAVGGQAIVYRATDALLDRNVAIKQISTHLAEEPKFLERFRKEAQILARLSSTQPAVTAIHDLIEDERGLFIVMEYVEGPSIEDVLRDTDAPVETKAVLQVLWRLAAAMHDVHAAGIIHRDLKPANLIICQGLRPKITDFGVAASLSGQTSMVLGTTKYMAPELYGGVDVDARADIYSLGFITYEMLLGRPKFNELFADVVRDKHSEALRWMKWHGSSEMTPPPAHEVNPTVPEALSGIVARMIAKKPEDRFQSMEELGRAIKTTFAKGARPAPRPEAGGRRRRGSTAGAAYAASGLNGLRDEDGLGPEDEADRLRLPPARTRQYEPPATAPLPKRSLSPRVKIGLAVVVVLSLVVAGVGLGLSSSRERARLGRERQDRFASAMEHYEQGRFEQATEAFGNIASQFAATPQGAQAGVMKHLSLAREALEEQDWRRVSDELSSAGEEIRSIQGRTDANSPLYQWTQSIRDGQIREITERASVAQLYESAEAAARAALANPVFVNDPDPGRRHDEARRALHERIGTARLDLVQDRFEAFRRQLDQDQVRARYEGFLVTAQGALAAGDYVGAERAYGQAAALLELDQARPLPERDELAQRVVELNRQLWRAREYDIAMDQADQARVEGSLQRELERLMAAYAIRASDQVAARIRQVQSDLFVEQAQASLRAGNVAEARDKLQQALEVDPQHAAARRQLEMIETAGQRSALIAQGDQAARDGDWPAAVGYYQQAQRLADDPQLAAKATDARYRVQLAQADALRDAERYDEALAAYERAREIHPARGPEIDSRRAGTEQRQTYARLLAAGDAQRDRSAWRAAREQYEQARRVLSTDEVEARIAHTRYQENLALGRRALNEGDLREALAYFRIAQRMENTAEVRQIIAQLEQQSGN